MQHAINGTEERLDMIIGLLGRLLDPLATPAPLVDVAARPVQVNPLAVIPGVYPETVELKEPAAPTEPPPAIIPPKPTRAAKAKAPSRGAEPGGLSARIGT